MARSRRSRRLAVGVDQQVLETDLEAEMEDHLSCTKHTAEGRNHGNSLNGTRSKTVITEIGPVETDVSSLAPPLWC